MSRRLKLTEIRRKQNVRDERVKKCPKCSYICNPLLCSVRRRPERVLLLHVLDRRGRHEKREGRGGDGPKQLVKKGFHSSALLCLLPIGSARWKLVEVLASWSRVRTVSVFRFFFRCHKTRRITLSGCTIRWRAERANPYTNGSRRCGDLTCQPGQKQRGVNVVGNFGCRL